MSAAPELLQRPVVGGPILLVLHLHSHDGAGEGPCLPFLGGLRRQQVRGQWRVEGVCEEDELELHLQGREQQWAGAGPKGVSPAWLLLPEALKGPQALTSVPTFFFSSTLIALASLRKTALPQSRSRRDVNWYHFHLRKAQSASSHSRSVHCTVGRHRGWAARTPWGCWVLSGPQPRPHCFKNRASGWGGGHGFSQSPNFCPWGFGRNKDWEAGLWYCIPGSISKQDT